MLINDQEHGSIIWVDNKEWIGVISLGGGAWLAYQLGDPLRLIRMAVEDEAPV